MKHKRIRTTISVVIGLLLSGSLFSDTALAQTTLPNPTAHAQPSAPWDRQINPAAVQADVWFNNYKFRDGETLNRLKIHYATLGTPHRNAQGDIDNAVLVLHWTGADSRALLSPTFTKALFAPGRPLDSTRYYLIFPDSVGLGPLPRVHSPHRHPENGMKMFNS